jgi:2-methylisocitrate lyase-like PEP mutase family enzyme
VDQIDAPVIITLVEKREPNLSVKDLNEIGAGMTIYALSALIKTAEAIHEMYCALHETGHTQIGDEEYDQYMDHVRDCIGLPRYYVLEEREGKK